MDPQSALPYRERVDAFRRQHRTGLVTLLFTDIVGSTALKQQLGDRAGADLFLKHHQLVRATLRQFPQGEEIETAGDSFLIIFATPSDAVQFALLFQARLGKLNQESGRALQERIGIHVGEVVMGADEQSQKPRDLFGIQIDTCSRVMSLAKAGQTLMTRAVFDSARQVLKGEDIEGLNQVEEEAAAKPSEGRVSRVPDLSQPQGKWGLVELVPPRESNQLSRGSQLEWLNHGPYLLKGLEEPVEICEVREAGRNTGGPPTTSEKAQRQARADEEPVLGWRPALGQVVPNTQWVLEKKLGEGGFGEVWLGRHQTMKERRVFKFCFRADRVRSLKREMTLFRVLKERVGDHPNIVRLLEVSFDEPPFYVVMDYVEGQDLKAWCEEQGGVEKVPLLTRLEIVAQIADALQAAHDAGVIHRDVKPGNILVAAPVKARADQSSGTNDTQPNQSQPAASQPQLQVLAKLTDFGIGQVVSEEALKGMTKAGFTQTIVAESSSSQTGSQMYMAPELLAGKPASTRSDIYSLGVVLYQLLVGDLTRPLTTDWVENISDSLLRDDLKHCFAGNPQDRFDGAGQLAKNLRSLPQRREQLAKQNAEVAAREKAAYRRGIALATSVAVIIVAAFALLAAYGFRQAKRADLNAGRANQQRDRTQITAYAADMNLAQHALTANNIGRVLDLLESHRPQPGQKDLRGWEWRYLWRQCRGDELYTFRGHSNFVTSVLFSPNGALLFSSSKDGTVRFWDVKSRREIARLAHPDVVTALALSDNGNLLATACWDNKIRVWDVETRGELWNFPSQQPHTGTGNYALAFSGDTILAGADADGRLALWDVNKRGALLTWTNTRPINTFGYLKSIRFSKSGMEIAVADMNEVKLSNASDGQQLAALNHPGRIHALSFSPDQSLLASAGFERTIKVWDLATRRELVVLTNHTAWISSVAFSPDGKTLATASADQTIKLWNTSTRRELATLRGHLNEVWSLSFSPDGNMIATGSKDDTIKLWGAKPKTEETRNLKLSPQVAWLRYSSDNRLALAVERNGASQLWDLISFAPITQFLFPATNFTSLDLSSSKILAIGDRQGGVDLWDCAEQRKSARISAHTNEITGIWFSPSGKRMLTRSRNPLIKIWDVTSRRQVNVIAVPYALGRSGSSKGSIHFSPDENIIATFTGRNAVLFDAVTGRERKVIHAHKDLVTAVTFSPDGKILATTSFDGTAKLWDVVTYREIANLGKTLLSFLSVGFSPDGQRVAAGTYDGYVILWDATSKQEVASLKTHTTPVSFVGFLPDGNTLISEGDARIARWPAATVEEIDRDRNPNSTLPGQDLNQ